MNIHLHIERLVLEGLPVRGNERTLVQAAVAAELTRLLAGEGLAGTSSVREKVAAREIHFDAGATARQIGTQIGRSVWGNLESSAGGAANNFRSQTNT